MSQGPGSRCLRGDPVSSQGSSFLSVSICSSAKRRKSRYGYTENMILLVDTQCVHLANKLKTVYKNKSQNRWFSNIPGVECKCSGSDRRITSSRHTRAELTVPLRGRNWENEWYTSTQMNVNKITLKEFSYKCWCNKFLNQPHKTGRFAHTQAKQLPPV